MPRLGDVYASLPAITGKMELEYEGELQGPDRIARELIAGAAAETFRTRAGGADVDPIVEYFEEGGALQVSPDAEAAACVRGFRTVPGLLEVVEATGLAGSEALSGVRAAACELVLEALVHEKRISRTVGGGYRRARHEGPTQGGGKGYQGFDPFGGTQA